jgi:glycosyltransferase involved in cell wall biosynthesis
MTREARLGILVLGMHRSGTSAVTRLLGLAGGELPHDPMLAVSDNPQGYWESRRISRFNNRLLESAGTRWNDSAAVSEAWFQEPARADDVAEAAALLNEEFPPAGTLVCKDPRICRLLPLWRRAFAMAGIAPRAVLVLRNPLEVAASLAARATDPATLPAAVVAPAGALLLWLRYVLEAERHSRDMPRDVVDYGAVLADWRTALSPVFAKGDLCDLSPSITDSIDAFLDPTLRRQQVDGGGPVPQASPSLPTVVREVWDAVSVQAIDTAARCDLVRDRLDRLLAEWIPRTGRTDPLAAADPLAEAVLAELDSGRLPGRGQTRGGRTALFLSASPTSVGHVYRVEHAVAALETHGWHAAWRSMDDPEAMASIEQADLVTVFRAPWGAPMAAVHGRCGELGIPLVFDIDDLLFDPEVIEAGCLALLDGTPEHTRQHWRETSLAFQQAVSTADAAVLTTSPLAAAARRLCPQALVLPNALSREMEVAAAAALSRPKPSAADGRPRLMFASGTPTHHRDFAVAAEATARLFSRLPEPLLVVVGHLDVGLYPALEPFRERIELRPRVPLEELFGELARGDVNLCPLELGNPFCESKSAVRWLAAAAVAVPSVGSPTGPLRDAIRDGETGILAADVSDWERALEQLVADDPDSRVRLGLAARGDALARFGFDPWSRLTADIYEGILERGKQQFFCKGVPA